jgi:hypothetical protein
VTSKPFHHLSSADSPRDGIRKQQPTPTANSRDWTTTNKLYRNWKAINIIIIHDFARFHLQHTERYMDENIKATNVHSVLRRLLLVCESTPSLLLPLLSLDSAYVVHEASHYLVTGFIVVSRYTSNFVLRTLDYFSGTVIESTNAFVMSCM